MIGWIKLHRKFQSWSWYHKSEMVHLFIHLLLKANHEPNKFEDIVIETGQFPTSLKSLHKETGISYQRIRTCLQKLENTKEITNKSTNKYRIITICNYSKYQIEDSATNKQSNNQLTINQQSTNNNIRSKEVKNDKNIYTQIEKFKKAVKDYVTENPKYHPVLFDFIKYWTEPSKSGKSFRYKDQKYFDMGKRLGTFYSNYIKKQRYNAPEEKRVEYKPLPKFKDFGEFVDYYVRFQSKGKDTLLPYPKKIKDLAYAFSHQQIRLDDAVKEWDKLRG